MTANDLAEIIRQAAAWMLSLDPTDLRFDVPFVDLGLDSLQLTEMLVSVEHALETALPEELLEPLQEAQTFHDVVAALTPWALQLDVAR